MKKIRLKIEKLFGDKIYLIWILGLITIALYIPVLDNDFSMRDDGWMLYNNDQIYNLEFENVFDYFTSISHGQYSPINTLCYGLIYYFADLNPFWYYFFNLSLHVTNVILVFFLIHELLKMSYKNDTFKEVKPDKLIYVPFFTALLFGIHPMQIESVGWISASKIVLSAFFFLLGHMCYLRYLESKKTINYILTLLAFFLAFGSKEQAVVFPLGLILIDYFIGRNFRQVRVIYEKAPFVLLAVLFGGTSLYAQDTGFHNMLQNHYYPFSQRLLLANFSFNEYIFKLIVPVNLSKFYRFPMAIGESVPFKYWFYPILIIIIAIYSWAAHQANRRYILFSLGFFVMNLVLTLHIIPMGRRSFIADRYVYLSTIGLFFFLVIISIKFYERCTVKNRKIALSLFSVYFIFLLAYTAYRTFYWN